MKQLYTKQLYELIYKHTRIKLDPQVFLGMVARAQTVDTRRFFFASGLGTRLVSCVHRRVVEGSGEGSGGCVVHVDVHGECVTLWVAAM